ncbi:hypothetical protein J1N10_15915 [Carboxylicivirga sp. A043]|uniref:hypothetical protein n=1 Tax=Carboxylicivirga litoralis TaxID=2816963 RepID=UPI0021CAF4F6|nr:hypothetical protein [Carboxylicivirga sp. A043]MCU4157464.1 hypothetical protein [Carboxylicivirga sp. A043]
MKDLNQLIEVTYPYNSLKDIRTQGTTVTASFEQELFDASQVEGITLAEAGRHIAILGSLAVANINPVKNKHFYLASKATLKRVHSRPCTSTSYRGIMNAIDFNKKCGMAEGAIHDSEGKILYTAEVQYSVLTVQLFERFFRKYKSTEFRANGFSPYGDVVKLYDMNLCVETSSASLGEVKPEWCVGHFDEYPALPVAQISQGLMNLAAAQNRLIKNKDNQFCIKEVNMDAESFIFAGQNLSFKSEYDTNNDYFKTKAYTEEVADAVSLDCWMY